MNLRDYLRVARRRWKLMLGVLIAFVGIATLVSLQATPQYSSATRLFVSTTPSDTNQAYQGSLFASERVSSYADLASGREMAARVIDRLGLTVDPSELVSKVEASAVPNTVLIEVRATDARPAEARRIAEAYAEELVLFVDELETPPGATSAPIKATVVDAASFDSDPVSPRTTRNVSAALLLGLFLGFGLALVRELLDNSIKSSDDVSEVTDAALMAHIAYDSQAAKRPLVTDLDSHAPRVEAFRVLRTNMQFVDIDGANKLFVVSSSVPAEGKTSTACNLALTLAAAGQRTLLVDGDLRRPRIADSLGLESTVGLTTVVLGRVSLNEAIQQNQATGLDVLTSGSIPPNPAELLQSHSMAQILDQLRASYDIVIVDAPPLLPVTDAALLGRQSDGVLLVIRHASTTRDQLAQSIDRLENVGAKTVGVVLNMIPASRAGGAYYGYGYGYAPSESPHTTRSGRRKRER